MNNKRAELHLHTKLSDDISVIEVEEVFENAKEFGLTTVAFTNLNNVQDFPAVLNAHKKHKELNLKVIYGAELRYMNESGVAPFGITVLVKNQEGIKDLYKIISSLHNDGVCDLIDLDVLKKNRKNLLIGSCGNISELYDAIDAGKDTEKIAAFYDYFEIYPTEDKKERENYKKIFELGEELGVSVVASGNCHYLDREDEICRRVILAVNGLSADNKRLFLHTAEEMLGEFSYLGKNAVKAVIEAPNQIVELTEQVTPLKEGVYPPEITDAYGQVHKLAYTKATELYGQDLPYPIKERLETELHHIKNGDFATHYLIAYHMVKHMNENGYYVGARGSVGSVLVAFLLGITDINPMPAHYYCTNCHCFDFDVSGADGFDLPDKLCPVCGNALKTDGHNIPFEFFMGYRGSKMPDIDLNFPSSKQYDVFKFLQELFGANRLAHGGTIATLWERFAEGYITVYESKTAEYFTKDQRKYICQKLCGIKRCEGNHPGGIFILPEGMEFEDFTPLRDNETNSPISKATHFDFHALHDTILKIDVLGYVVPDMFRLLEKYTGRTLYDVAWNDKTIYSQFENADTTGILEFDSDFMRDMLQMTRPKSFDDLVRISGLSHGTNTWIDNGEELLRDGHSISELPALREDVFLQLLDYGVERENAFKIAEYVRRGRFYFDSDVTNEFVRILQKANVPKWYIQSLRKNRYMFPKAHAVAYVMNAVRMAWFKIHYPVEFYAAYLSCHFDIDEELTEEDALKLEKIITECLDKGIVLLEADVKKSDSKNYIVENGNIRMPYRRRVKITTH